MYCRKFLSALLCNLVERRGPLGGRAAAACPAAILVDVQDTMGMLSEIEGEERAPDAPPRAAAGGGHARYAGLVSKLLRCLAPACADLSRQWTEIAIGGCAPGARARPAIQSLRVLRELQAGGPEFPRSGVQDLVEGLLVLWQRRPGAAGAAPGLDTDRCVETALTLRQIVGGMPSKRLLLQPEIFWTCVSMLSSSLPRSPRVFVASCSMLSLMLQRLDVHDETTGMMLLAATAPPAANGGTPARSHRRGRSMALTESIGTTPSGADVLAALARGLALPETEPAAAEALLCLISHPSPSLLGDPVRNAVAAVAAFLPRIARALCPDDGREDGGAAGGAGGIDSAAALVSVSSAVAALSGACRSLELHALADELGAALEGSAEGFALAEVIGALVAAIEASTAEGAQRAAAEGELLSFLVGPAFSRLREAEGGGPAGGGGARIAIAILHAVVTSSPSDAVDAMCARAEGVYAADDGEAGPPESPGGSSPAAAPATGAHLPEADWLSVARLAGSADAGLSGDAIALLSAVISRNKQAMLL